MTRGLFLGIPREVFAYSGVCGNPEKSRALRHYFGFPVSSHENQFGLRKNLMETHRSKTRRRLLLGSFDN